MAPVSYTHLDVYKRQALAIAAIWLSGISTYSKGVAALRRGQLNMNALMGVAVTGAFLIGQWPEAAMVMACLLYTSGCV